MGFRLLTIESRPPIQELEIGGQERIITNTGPMINLGQLWLRLLRMNSGNILGLSSNSNHAGWNAPVIPTAEGIYPGFIIVIFNGVIHLMLIKYEFVYSFNRSNNVNKFYRWYNKLRTVVNTDNRSTSYLFLGDVIQVVANDTSSQSKIAGDYERFLFYNRVYRC